ncbi:MAG: FAD-binding oxidoreductase [Gammaproteobacteria bacterium]
MSANIPAGTNRSSELVEALRNILGAQCVITSTEACELLSGDLYSQGKPAAAIIRPSSTQMLASAAELISAAGYALIPRGGGMSYTGGACPVSEASIVIDTTDLQDIVNFDPGNMVVTVGAGTTWETIYKHLSPHGLRLPYFGTFSGRRATVGGGLSNGAVFLGTSRYGSAAENVLGLEIVTADGRILQTGQAGFRHGKPFYRTHGPDLTGLFVHDGGALGIKTAATFRLIEMPRHSEYLSSAFPDARTAATALSVISRSGAAEEAYVFDSETTSRNMAGSTLKGDIATLGRVVSNQKNLLAGLKAGARLIGAGKRLVPEGAWSLHLVCAGRSEAAAKADLDLCRNLLNTQGGKEIPASIPVTVRAAPFNNLNAVLGPAGERWVALNAKVPHSDALQLIDAFNRMIEPHKATLHKVGVELSTLLTTMQTHAFSFETVFHWLDSWLPMHRAVPDPEHLARLTEPQPNLAAREMVARLRHETLALFDSLGAASNQLGRTYSYANKLTPENRALLMTLKSQLDPQGLMNPGVLGLSVGSSAPTSDSTQVPPC